MAQYEYDLFKPEEVHMAIAAEQIVTGMYEKVGVAPDLPEALW